MTQDILSSILRRFIIYLEVLPYNLRLFAHTALFFFATINIALTIYNNIDNDNFNYLKWGRVYILKIGFILWVINKYEWFLAGIKDFFFYAVEKAIRIKYTTNDYIMDPSRLYSQGQDVAGYIKENFISLKNPISSIGYWIFYFLILIGFLILTIQIITCWIEYYFLTGFAFIFLPFGALDLTLEPYKNLFKLIMGASIKLAVMQFWLLLCSVILKDIFKISRVEGLGITGLGLLLGSIYVIVAIMQFLPSMTSSLLMGSPTMNTSQAAGVVVGSAVGSVIGTMAAAKGAGKGGKKGSDVGGAVGTKIGAIFGGPIGAGVGAIGGKIVGGAIGATVGGAYAGAKYGFTKRGLEKEDKKDENSSKEKKTTKTETTNNDSSTVPGTTPTSTDTGKNNSSSTTSSSSSENNNTTVAPVSTDTSTGIANNNSSAVNTDTSSTTTNNNSTNTPAVDTSTGNSTNVNTTNSSSTQGDKIETSNNYSSSTSSENTSTTNSSNVINNNTTTNESIGRSERVKNSLPDWAKEDY